MDTIGQILRNVPKGFVSALLLNGIVVTLVYFLVWKRFGERLKHWRIQVVQQADAAQIRAELKNGLLVLSVGALFSGIVLYLSTQGYTKLYTDFSQHSPLVAIGGFFLIWLIDDTWFYWCHRLLHHPSVYRYVHTVHHRSVDVTPYSSLSFHVLEAALLTFWIFPVSFLLPVYAPALGIMQLVGLFNNVKSHVGYEFYPAGISRSLLWFLVPSTHHNLHHTQFNGNYGLHFRFWDKLCGTEFRDYEAVFEQVQQRRRTGAQRNGEVRPTPQLDDESKAVAEAVVHFPGERHVAILANETVLEALLRAGINVPYSCRAGACGTCKSKLIRGQVVMRNREALTEEEINQGYVLICQSMPVTAQIELQY